MTKATALAYLQEQANLPCTTRTELAQGVLWADSSCRIDGTLAIALHSGTPAGAERLLNDMQASGVSCMGDVPRWLLSHRNAVLGWLEL